MLGTAEETVAGAVGATEYQKAGQQRRAEGDAEYKVAPQQPLSQCRF